MKTNFTDLRSTLIINYILMGKNVVDAEAAKSKPVNHISHDVPSFNVFDKLKQVDGDSISVNVLRQPIIPMIW